MYFLKELYKNDCSRSLQWHLAFCTKTPVIFWLKSGLYFVTPKTYNVITVTQKGGAQDVIER